MFLILMLLSFILLFLILSQEDNKSKLELFLKTSLIFGVFIWGSTELLSLLNRFSFSALRIVWGLFFAILLLIFFLNFRKKQPIGFNLKKTAFAWDEWILLIGSGGLALINGWVAFQTPPNNWDSMVYHLSRIQHWFQNQNINYYATHVHRQLFMSPWMEFGLAHVLGLSGNDQFLNLFGYFFWIGTALLVSYLTKIIGASPRAQILAGLAALFIPSSLLQASTTKNDLALSFWILAAIITFLEFQKQPDYKNAFYLGSSIGLAILTKTTAYVLLAPVVVWFLYWMIREKKWFVVKFGLFIGGLVVILNISHTLRNISLYQNPMGPAEETVLYSNELIGFRPVLSNMIRNTIIHLRTTESANKVLFNAANTVHQWIGLDISDPRTTWPGYQFELPPFRVNEDESGAPFHLFYFVIALIFFFVKKTHRLYPKLTPILIILGVNFVLFSGYLKWQFWQARLMISFFMLASILIGVVFADYFKRRIQFLSIGLILLLGLVCIWKNPTKPLPYLYDFNIVNMPRVLVMIYDNSLKVDYMAAYEYLDRDLNCHQIGLITDNGDWEYPFWVLLSDDFQQPVRLEHVNVTNQSGVLEDLTFNPCAVMDMTKNRSDTVVLKNGSQYELANEWGEMSIYIKTDQP